MNVSVLDGRDDFFLFFRSVGAHPHHPSKQKDESYFMTHTAGFPRASLTGSQHSPQTSVGFQRPGRMHMGFEKGGGLSAVNHTC